MMNNASRILAEDFLWEAYFRDTYAWINKLVWSKDKNGIRWSLELVLACENGSESTDSMKAGHDILSDYEPRSVQMVQSHVF